MTEGTAEFERKLADARAEARRLRKIVETGDDIISLISSEQVTTYITPAGFELATGIPVEKHRGTNAFDWLHPEDRPVVTRRFAELVAAGAGSKARLECRHLRADGSWTWIECVACNMIDDTDVGGVVVISRIIDDAVRLREELRTVNERYVTAQRISREAVWERNLIDDTMTFSPAASALLGYGMELLPTTVQQTFPLLHPDDVPAQQVVIQAALRGEGTGDSEARVRHQSGEYRWIRIHRVVERDSNGRPARIIAHATDIHDRKAAEFRLIERSRRDVLVGRVSRLLVDGAPSAVEAALVVIGAHFESSRVSVQRVRSPGVLETLAVWTPDDARRLPATQHVDESFVSLVLDALHADEGAWARGDAELSSAVRAVQGTENAEARSVLLLPLVDQRVVGWIALEHPDASWTLSQEDVALTRLLAEILSIAHARSQAENRTRLAAMRDELIGEISRRFLDADPERALDGVLERVGTTFEFERVSVFAPDAERQRLTCTHRWTKPGVEVGWESLEAYPVPPGAFAQLAGSSSPSPEPSYVRVDEWLTNLQREAGTRTLQAPIGYGGRVFGLLVARMRPSRVWNDDDAITLRSVGEVIAVARVRRAAELALAEAKEAAVAASAAKSSFLANMSHELRTPLNGVIGMVDLLSGTQLDEHQQRFCDVARSSANALLAVIDDVLDFSKIEANKLELEAAPFDLRNLIGDVVEMLALQAQSRGLRLAAKTDPAVAFVVGDAARVRQVLVNLVSNAIKFTSEGAVSIRSRVTKEDEGLVQVRIEVEDTGIGLPPDAERRLFKPFSQLDGSFARRQGGTGLGLAISRDLIERMGGRIGVMSELGRGSTFWFEVPFTRASSEGLRSDGLPGMRPVVVSDDDSVGPLARKRVLVVEDSPVNALVTTELLRRAGADYELAENGKRAIELARSSDFDLILMDCHLPDMDGYETTRRLRAHGLQTPIVALTASATTEDLARCFAAGMNDRVLKPVDARRFVELLARHIEERGVPESTTTRVFDAGSALERMRGDRDLFGRVCTRFREIASGDRRALSAAVQARDARATLALAHRLRGQAGAIGGLALMDALAALESVAGETRWAAASASLLAVEAELDKLLLALARVV